MQFLEEESIGEDKAPRKRWFLWSSIILAVLVLGTAGYIIWESREQPPQEVIPAPTPPPEPEPEPELEPPPPPAPTSGSLAVSSDVEGATVYVNGKSVGLAPHRAAELAPGSYRIRVEKEGYEPFEQVVQITAGRSRQVRAALTRAMASLKIHSDVPGASVFLDREYLGTTPLELKGVEPGTHELTASVDGYDMYAETVELDPEPRDILISFKAVKLDESIPVIHKHTFGECRGTLRATLQGLRYETAHEHAFFAPFAALERFEVDYMDKNLNIKIKGGKNYNFTAQSGNPDDLFVFHQRVQDAIQKLRDLGAQQ